MNILLDKDTSVVITDEVRSRVPMARWKALIVATLMLRVQIISSIIAKKKKKVMSDINKKIKKCHEKII